MTQKNLYIRCDEETYKLAHAMAKKDNRSLNRELIHIIHKMSEDMNIVLQETADKYQSIGTDNADLYVQEEESFTEVLPTESGLQKLSEIKRSDSAD